MKLLEDQKTDCACIQETQLGQRTPKIPSQYITEYYSPTPDAVPGKGLAMILHTSISYKRLTLQTPLQAMACTVGTPTPCTICNLYVDHHNGININQLNHLINQLPEPYILVGDFNAKHIMWGNTITDQRGYMIENFLINNDSILLNDKRSTHYHIQTDTYSSIDLSFTSSQISNNFEWNTLDDLHGSDHYPIIIKSLQPVPITLPSRFIMKRANWRLFENITRINNNNMNYYNPEELLDIITTILLSAAHSSIPTSSGKNTNRRVPWWSDECTRAVIARKQALRRYQHTKLPIHKVAFNRAKAFSRRTIKTAKYNSWKSFISTITKETPMKKIWKRIRKMKGSNSPIRTPCIDHNNATITEPQDIANILAEHYSSISSTNSYDPQFRRIRHNKMLRNLDFHTAEDHYYNVPITMRELECSLQQCNNTAPGEDQITYTMIKRAHPSMRDLILKLFNIIWTNHQFPANLRHAVILSFLKQDKPSNEVASYRPIALTSCIGKLMEKIINSRLTQYLECNSILSNFQYGFRKQRSTIDSLTRFENDIRMSFSRHEMVLCVFFDLTKAYDTTCRVMILQELKNSGISGNMAIYIQNFLSERTFSTIIGNSKSRLMIQEEGVPQGSVLSCSLFSLALNSIARCLPPNIECSMYVDDFMIYSSSSQLASLQRRIQLAINRVTNWTQQNGLKINNRKTFGMLFHRKRIDEAPTLKLYNRIEIEFPPSVKFLGMHFDSSLNWKFHIRKLKTKCTKRLAILKNLSHLTWGADRHTLIQLYNALIRPLLDYGSVVYSSANDSILQTLNPIHNSALRISMGAFKSTPIISLYAESGEMPLKYRRKQLLIQYYNHLLSSPNNPTNLSIHNLPIERCSQKMILPRILNTMTELDLAQATVTPDHIGEAATWLLSPECICSHFDYPSKSTCSTNTLYSLFMEHKEQYHNNEEHIYTDGSKSNEGVGCAAISQHTMKLTHLPNEASIFTAELAAVSSALNIVSDSQQQEFVIFTDSQSVLTAIQNIRNSNPLVNKIQKWLIDLHSLHKRVTICWVPGHANIPNNERADEEARNAITLDIMEENREIPRTDYYLYIKRAILSKWDEEWTNVQLNKLREIKPTIKQWPSSENRCRTIEVKLARLRMGHTHLTHHHLMERREQPYCDDCLVPLTVRHLIAECPSLQHIRWNHYPLTSQMNESETMKHILADNGMKYDTHTLGNFLNDIDIINKI